MRNPKKGALSVFLLLFIAIFSSFSSAEILMGQTKALYNVGDKFEITLTLSPTSQASGFLTANLICGEKNIEFYKNPQSILPGEKKEVKIETNLDNFLVEGVKGDCQIQATYGPEQATSPKFQITDEVSVGLNIEGIIFGPEEDVKVFGLAKKANGEALTGFIEISVPGIDFKYTEKTTNGNFNFSFKIPENAKSGGYDIYARAYEKDLSEKIINSGNTSGSIRIKQVIKEVEIALSNQAVSPKEEFTYSVILYDQAKDRAEADVSITIFKPKGSIFEQKIARSGETLTVPLRPTSPPGYWKIQAKSGDLETTKDFLVEEYKDLSFTLANETLIIENTGNVPFTGPVSISIGDKNQLEELKDFPVGHIKKFELKAPNGMYAVEVREGSETQQLGNTFLTGRAISIKAIDEGGTITTSLWVLGSLILLLAAALVIVYIYKRISQGKLGTTATKEAKNIPAKKVGKILAAATTQKVKEKSQTIIDKGEKQESSIVSLSIKNLSSLGDENSEPMKTIDSALWKAKEAGAKIYSDGNYRIMVFAPVLTKEKENEVKAIHAARTIERLIKAHNRRGQTQIEFGIGVNSGTLIVESSQERFRFMSLNNIIATTKRISELANSETLISESTRNKTVGKIKSTKLSDRKLWRVEKVVDRSAYADHVRNLTKKK